ncbi:MAG: hypothetical protein IPL61_34155 [Myxococcales bacterium]|nr:hypothetical protein [Myxococcales bacterium]
MATEEKSRDAFDPTKRYASVGMQLGRVLVDDDWNEAERIHLEDDRRVQLDVIGPVGSPDDGFAIDHGHLTGGRCDFDIGAGTLYLGGLRLWNPTPTTFALQGDWLGQAVADRPTLAVDRTDLVYVEAWQQPVTAVEDSELFEVALGGPDTSTRLRTMWRVRVAPGAAGADCPAAWKALVDGWAAAGAGVVDATGERTVDAALTVTYTAGAVGDLCAPAIAAGFLGAENQTIRVQLVDATHLTWGYDNGAPLYRATIGADRRTITLATDPRDQAHWPSAGQVVEVLPWSAVLSNGEKLADETGHLARVTTGYDPGAHAFVLDALTPLPAGFETAWSGRADAAALAPGFVFVRVWNRGDDHASAPAIPFVVGTPLALGTTGLQVEITGVHRARGDHWIIAARPKTPDQVVPWALEDGRLAHGTRRFFAPLALVRWRADGSFDRLHDCRPHFLPLTRLRGCCTHTVGDEVSSFGRFTSIQAAIDALPEAGGKVCVLPGTYVETVTIVGRAHVTIEGCGARTRWRPDEGKPWTLLVVGGHDLIVRDLLIDAGEAFGIVLFDAAKGANVGSMADAAWSGFERRLARVRLEELRIEVLGRSAIAAIGGVDVTIRGCELLAGPLAKVIDGSSDLGRWPTILSFADDVAILDNRVLARVEDTTVPGAVNAAGQVTYTRTALGGVQLGGGTERAQVRRNHVEGGNGDGITLGSWAWVRRKVRDDGAWSDWADDWSWLAGISITINEAGCIEIDWDPPPPDDDGDEWVPVSMGDLYDVRITDNDITRMGRAGVGVVRFFDLAGVDEIVGVHGLELSRNRIHGCVRLAVPAVPLAMRDVSAAGAIVLADVDELTVRDNDVVGNGRRHTEPICGVFALRSSGVVIERNRIIDNAPFAATEEPIRPGWRGGVVLYRALPPAVTLDVGLKQPLLRQDGQPSARIADNVIVVPSGRAILALAVGQVAIVDNHLTVRGAARADVGQIFGGQLGEDVLVNAEAIAANQGTALQTLLDFIGGVAVLVVDLGMSNELFGLQIFSYLGAKDVEPGGDGLDAQPPIAASGQILFDDNVVGVDLLGPPLNTVLSAVALISLDDVGIADNQIEIDRAYDRVLATVIAFGLTTRMTGNRVKEAILPGTAAAVLGQLFGVSALTVGLFMNNTSANQTTRCLTIAGARKIDAPNQVFLSFFSKSACEGAADSQRVVAPFLYQRKD